MFTDRVKLKLIAGKGGDGIVAWRREKFIPKGGPCGGNGGNGGSVIIKTSTHLNALDAFKHKSAILAKNGGQGGSNNRKGKNGEDLILQVPVGTIVRDIATGNVLYDLTEKDETITLCKGGRGGLGNTTFKSSTNRTPFKRTLGKPGEAKEVELELKLIADVGFLGMPNAGKSTLLTHLTNAKVKTGAYPFTTLIPSVSYVEYDDFSRIYLADIPGIIKDAHKNRGLGLEFLKHIQRSRVLVYVIDAAGTDNRNPLEDFLTLRNELESYSVDLINKPFFVLLNKIDKAQSQTFIREFCDKFPFEHKNLFQVSALDGQGLSIFIDALKPFAFSKSLS